MSGKELVRIQSPLNLEYLLLKEMNCGTNKDVVFLCSGGKKVGYVKSLLCASFPLFWEVLPSSDSEKFLPKDSQIFVTMDEVDAELLVEYLATSLSGSERGTVDLRFSELDSMLKQFQVHDHDKKEDEDFGDMFETLVNEILEDCVRVRKSESIDSQIIQELDSNVEEEMEPTAKLTMSCIKSKSPAQFYRRSYTSEPEEDTQDQDFDDLEVKMETSITGVDEIVDEITDEFCNSDSSTLKQPIVQVTMDVIREVLADPIDESLTVKIALPIDADAECSTLATSTKEPLQLSNYARDSVIVFNESTPDKYPKEKQETNQESDSHVKEVEPSENELKVVETKIRKRCQLTLVKTKEQIEWEKFPEKLGLIRKPNPGEKNKSKIPKKVKTRRPMAEKSLVAETNIPEDASRDRVKNWLAESSSSTSPESQSSSSGTSEPEPLNLHCPQPQSPISSTAPEPPSSGKRDPVDLPTPLSPLSPIEEQAKVSLLFLKKFLT